MCPFPRIGQELYDIYQTNIYNYPVGQLAWRSQTLSACIAYCPLADLVWYCTIVGGGNAAWRGFGQSAGSQALTSFARDEQNTTNMDAAIAAVVNELDNIS